MPADDSSRPAPEPPKACCAPSVGEAVPPRAGPWGTMAARGGSSAAAQHLPGAAPLIPVAEPARFADTGDTAGMVRLDGGVFRMGTDDPDGFPEDGEGPVREVTLPPFWIDATAVTVAQFAAFVADTGYITDAQRFGWSFVFHLHLPPKYAQKLRADAAMPGLSWWVAVPGARWNHPFGERSSVKGLQDHPVTQVSFNDAVAYAAWAGKRLPTEAQWEYAARGGTSGQPFFWGGQLEPRGGHRCNVWQGKFPTHNSAADGYVGTCPVTAFTPNAFGLYNTTGNVWEWTADWFSATWHAPASNHTRDNPLGPIPHDEAGRDGSPGTDGEPALPHGGYTHKVQKGGSYLCHASYCNRYRLGARTGNTPDSAATNSGFRCVRDV